MVAWHQLDHMQIICDLLQTDNHASTSSLNVFTVRMLFLTPSQQCQSVTTITTTTVLQPFVQDYPGEPVPEETLTQSPTHHPDHHPILINFFHLPWSIASSRSNCVLGNLFAQPLSMSSLVYLLVWSPPPHIPYISSPKQCLFFVTHAHTIATCFAVKA